MIRAIEKTVLYESDDMGEITMAIVREEEGGWMPVRVAEKEFDSNYQKYYCKVKYENYPINDPRRTR